MEAARKHRQLAELRDAPVKARSLAGLEDFLQPKKFATLLKAARAGIDVIVIVNESQCDAESSLFLLRLYHHFRVASLTSQKVRVLRPIYSMQADILAKGDDHSLH